MRLARDEEAKLTLTFVTASYIADSRVNRDTGNISS